ncbi:MAG: protein kinase, partial [Sedimentisphaerales bacterium]|nr:protein kinase [Sedimentisphaerales bacterium]
ALKVLPPVISLNQAAAERFHREAQAAAKLHHTNIVAIYAEGQEKNLCYYAMELIEGQNLDQIIQYLSACENSKNKPDNFANSDTDSSSVELDDILKEIPLIKTALNAGGNRQDYFDIVARLMADVADALEYAHQNNIIHRDVKPSNLMLGRNGRLTLMDFGLARILQEKGVTVTGSFIGTPHYMSPEQIDISRGTLDHRTDIYSFGATLYELLTFRPPFQGDNREQLINQILTRDPPRPRKLNGRIPVDLDTICGKAMEKNPEHRYQSAGECADDLLRFVNRYVIRAKRSGPTDRLIKFVRRQRLPVTLALIIVVMAFTAGILTWKYYTTQWAQEYAIPTITQLIDQDKYYEAFSLARRADRFITKDKLLGNLWNQMSRYCFVSTNPADARLYISPYSNKEQDWFYLGNSPLDNVRIPLGSCRWKIEKEGYETLEVVRHLSPTPHWERRTTVPLDTIDFILYESGRFPADMVRIPSTTLGLKSLYHLYDTIPSAPAYLIDKYEVTNQQFKEFIDQGGYSDRKYWKHEFIQNGNKLSWNEAINQFRDQTGQPGPAEWENGDYPADQANYPVGGVSWYEAAAFAEFKEKSLPTVFHWIEAAQAAEDNAFRITQYSNFGRRAAPVGKFRGMGKYGLLDAAGNVREWCYNAVDNPEDNRCILGGGWGEPQYMFNGSVMRSPWDRDRVNGFRCAVYPDGIEIVPRIAFTPLKLDIIDFSYFKPVSDDILQSYINNLYSYDKTELHPVVESVIESMDESLAYCRREKITLDTAYPNERVTLYLHLPKGIRPPYQTIVWFPNADAGTPLPSEKDLLYDPEISIIIESGRALIYPVYQGTYERRTENVTQRKGLMQRRDLRIQRYQDLARCIDYLETRDDIDMDNLAYVGLSWGAHVGPIMMAVDQRFKTGIFLMGGLGAYEKHPAAEPANFAPHIKVPILMINGQYDSIFPIETFQKPLLELLGSAEKKHIVFPTGHIIPWEYLQNYQKHIENWLNSYLGPVQKQNLEMQSLIRPATAAKE